MSSRLFPRRSLLVVATDTAWVAYGNGTEMRYRGPDMFTMAQQVALDTQYQTASHVTVAFAITGLSAITARIPSATLRQDLEQAVNRHQPYQRLRTAIRRRGRRWTVASLLVGSDKSLKAIQESLAYVPRARAVILPRWVASSPVQSKRFRAARMPFGYPLALPDRADAPAPTWMPLAAACVAAMCALNGLAVMSRSPVPPPIVRPDIAPSPPTIDQTWHTVIGAMAASGMRVLSAHMHADRTLEIDARGHTDQLQRALPSGWKVRALTHASDPSSDRVVVTLVPSP